MISSLRILSLLKETNSLFTNNFILKICSIFFLLLISISFGFMPYFITACRKSNKFLSLSNSFSAGIFLGLGFFHILPEAAELLHEKTEFPLAYVCCFLSYALNLFIDKIIFGESHDMLHGGHNHEFEHEKNEDERNEHFKKNKENEDNLDNNENKEEKQILDIKINQKHVDSNNSSLKNMLTYKLKNTNEENFFKPSNKRSSISYLLLLALGFHGLFEGISLGIQQTTKGTFFLFLAIILHKWAAALTLGISFVKSGVSQKEFVINIFIFSFITPIGISIGMILTTMSNDLMAGIFLSISVGTFIYIACSEIIIHEFSKKENKYIKFFCFILGAGMVLSLNTMEFLSGHNHKH